MRRAMRLTERLSRVYTASHRAVGRRATSRPALRLCRLEHLLRPFNPRRRAMEQRKARLKAGLRDAAVGVDFHLWWHPHNFSRHPRESLIS